jgi:hydroxymethylpyrimidine/phosphomethylpyrimidine kinase
MSARTVILNALDPTGEQGLAIDVQAAFEAGATDVMPIATATLVDGVLQPADPKVLEGTLAAALEHPVQALLVGRLATSRIAGVIAGALARNLPETMVFAPGEFIPPRTWFAGSAERQQRAHFQTLTRECTVAVMTAAEVTAWLGDGEFGAEQAGEKLCSAGAYAAWIRDDSGSVRALDHVVTGEHKAVLDYPTIDGTAPDRIPGALTALLAGGLTLEEAVAGAQRHAACPNTTGAAVCR